MAQSAQILKLHMQTLARELQALGFKLNQKKCVWEPVQAIEFLGFLVNSKTMKIYLPEEKIEKVMKKYRHAINKRSVTARHLAHLIGLLSSTTPAVSVVTLHYRGLQGCTEELWRSRSPMVGRTRARIERSPSCPALSRHSIDNRWLEIWLGSNTPGKWYQGYVNSGREESPHKLPRDESSSTSLADLRLDKTEYSHPVAARQLISHCIHKPQRGNSL